MTVFTTRVAVRFRHCDPAGIVFYPRYFEILNDVVEDWFAAMGWGFSQMMGEGGLAVPLVAVQAEFASPSHLGDVLIAAVGVTTMGRTSCGVAVTLSAEADGLARVRFEATMVCVRRASLRPEPWPEEIRAAMQAPATA